MVVKKSPGSKTITNLKIKWTHAGHELGRSRIPHLDPNPFSPRGAEEGVHYDTPTEHRRGKTGLGQEASQVTAWPAVGGLVRDVWSFVLHSSVPEVLLIATLILARYLRNSDFSYPWEVVLPIVLFGILSTGFFYLYKWLLRRTLPAHVATLLLMYGLYGYTYTFPSLHKIAGHLTPQDSSAFTSSVMMFMVLFVAMLGIAALVDWLVRHVSLLRRLQLHKVVVFAVCFIFAVQFLKVGGRLWTIRHQLGYTVPTALVPSKPTAAPDDTSAKPNIYYLLFDRYSNRNILANSYGYDNSDLLNFLSGQGFVTRDQAYSNYPFTHQSVSSTLAMSYFPALGAQFSHDGGNFQTGFPYRAFLANPPIAQVLKQNGYTYNQVASWWDFTRVGINADRQPSRTFRLRILGQSFWMTDLQRDLINKSILSPWLLKGLTFGHASAFKYDKDIAPRQNFEEQMTALKTIAAGSATQSTPQFAFAHFMVPHDPYIFNADGSDPAYDGNRTDRDVDETVKYVNQLTYLNIRVKDVISYIRSKDPAAAIILQSDEGPYPKQFRGKLSPTYYYDPVNLPLAQMQQKFGILASYYLPGMTSDQVAGQLNSPVNAFRVVLNNYLGYSLPLLPDCQFTAGNKYQMYTFQLVTGKLHGIAEPQDCRQYQ